MTAADNLRARARAAVAEAEAALDIAERLAALTLAVANESARAASLAVRAASKLPVARGRVIYAQRAMADAEAEAVRLSREERAKAERDASPALTDDERRQLRVLRPERKVGQSIIPIPGISIDTLFDSDEQARVDKTDRFVERPATGERAYAIRRLLKLYASKLQPSAASAPSPHEVAHVQV
jgi:hypothetical protein